jgi:tetratricopeptide (TPR) repeat protein
MVIYTFRIFHRQSESTAGLGAPAMKFYLISIILVFSAAFVLADQPSSKNSQPKASQSLKTSPRTQTAPRSATHAAASGLELHRRYDALIEARSSGDPETVAAASRSVLGLALHQAGNLRMLVNKSDEAAELYRRSLTWEEVPATHLDLAIAEMRSNHIDDSLAEINSVLANSPNDARAWHVKASARIFQKDYPGAIESLNHSLALRKDVNAEFALGSAYLLAQQKPKAVAVFQSMLASYGDRAIWHVVFGGAYREAEMMPEAADEFKKAIALEPTIDNAHFFLGLTLLEQNMWARTDESMAEFREAVRLHPNDYAANFYLGVGESQLQLFEDSDKHLRTAAEAQPNGGEVWLYLGLNAYQQRKNEEARKYFLKALDLSEQGAPLSNDLQRRGYIALGRIYHIENNQAEAERWIEKAKAAQIKSMEGSSESISEITGGMAGTPTMPRINVQEKVATPAQEAPLDAAAPVSPSMLASTSLNPADQKQADALDRTLRAMIGTAYNDLGTADARRGLYLQALERFHEGEKWDSKTPGLMRNIGFAALKTNDQVEAARALKAAVALDSSDRLARSRLSMALFKTGKFPDAVEQFKAMGADAYSDPGIAYAYAYSLVRTSQPKQSGEVLTRLSTMQLSPDLLVGVGDLYAQLEDYEHAVASYRSALQLAPTMAGTHFKIGASLIRLEKSEAAISELKTELESHPSNNEATYYLAYADLETSRKDEGLALLRHLIEIEPGRADAQYLLGKTLVSDQRFEEAVPHLEAAVRLNPSSSYAHYQLQLAYRRVGRTADADREAAIYRDMKNRKREQVVIPMPEPQR